MARAPASDRWREAMMRKNNARSRVLSLIRPAWRYAPLFGAPESRRPQPSLIVPLTVWLRPIRSRVSTALA